MEKKDSCSTEPQRVESLSTRPAKAGFSRGRITYTSPVWYCNPETKEYTAKSGKREEPGKVKRACCVSTPGLYKCSLLLSLIFTIW